jgi:choline dehydrogenase-like flavoprotein
MTADFDVIIVGSGPAGVSAALPLVTAGLRVLMVDGGSSQTVAYPEVDYLTLRTSSDQQWRSMVGGDFLALNRRDAVSPKLRVPSHAFAFDDFQSRNRIQSEEFVAMGSLATGGLSNAWGCGVGRYSSQELADFPFAADELDASYRRVCRRIGVSGQAGDDMSGYLGLDDCLQPPIPMDALHEGIYDAYVRRRHRLNSGGFMLGRSRVAALSQALGERQACSLSGNCLWGCARRSLYSANEDRASLLRHENFREMRGFLVDGVSRTGAYWTVRGGLAKDKKTSISARKVLLAAGTLATTRIVLCALELREKIRLLSCPTAAFMLWLPHYLGRSSGPGFALGQHSFALQLSGGYTAFGSTFSTTGIPVTEFLRAVPLRRRYGVDLLRVLLSSCVVGNVFLPGRLSNAEVVLQSDDSLKVAGSYSDLVSEVFAEARKVLRSSYLSMGAVMLPRSFTVGRPGSDIHYAGTLPMRRSPSRGETDAYGEVAGLKDLHVVDGACLSSLSEKSHTLTIMANADRIAHHLTQALCSR